MARSDSRLGHWYSATIWRGHYRISKAELVAVAWHNRTTRNLHQHLSVRGYDHYADLLEREEIDIVHLAPPVAEMPACTILAAQAGKHIILGKPMAMTLEQADQMVAAVERRASLVSCCRAIAVCFPPI